mmetsp:Transcript_1653/g.2722  ORF Transcript_1653/g.2722 Transcript_1653/m.2722 type:complete len:236 (-) Transcript_1653:458-1165(-)
MVNIQDNAYLASLLRLVGLAIEVHGGGVGQQHVVGHQVRLRGAVALVALGAVGAAAGGEAAHAVAVDGHRPRLVQREPALHAVPELLKAHVHVSLKIRHDLVTQPRPVLVVQGLRGVPVEQRHVRRDAGLLQEVEDAVVVGEARGVGRGAARGQHPRPGDGQPVGLHAQGLQYFDIIFYAVVLIIGNVAILIVVHFSWCLAEGVPHRHASAILIVGSLHLVRRCCCPKNEVFREH